MFRLKIRVYSNFPAVRDKAEYATFKNLGQAGAVIRKLARNSIRIAKNPSTPGTPPHSRTGNLKRAILFAIDRNKQSVVIGPDADVVGTSGAAHEFGGAYKRERYDKRPFMGPALEKVKDQLPKFWANSVKG
ncbi:MAG: hypothetical protein ACREJ2_03160 [Planctomycetota bacterium]